MTVSYINTSRPLLILYCSGFARTCIKLNSCSGGNLQNFYTGCMVLITIICSLMVTHKEHEK